MIFLAMQRSGEYGDLFDPGRHGGRPSTRKHPVHQPVYERFNTPVIVFVTVCTKDKKAILDNAAAHETLLAAWHEAHSWLVGRYVIMPDHVHLFCAPGELHPKPLLQWVSYWKSYAARNWPRPGDAPVWQRHFWDTQLRRGENYSEKWEYVLQNPVRAGLVARPEEWPFAGEVNSCAGNGGTGAVPSRIVISTKKAAVLLSLDDTAVVPPSYALT